MKETKLIFDVDSLALVTKSEQQKKSKVVIEESKSDISNDELWKKEKVLMVTNPKKIFMKNFSRFKNNNQNRGVSGGSNYKEGNSSSENSKEESY